MDSQRIIILVFALSVVYLPVQGRPAIAIDYDYDDNTIPSASEISTPKAIMQRTTSAKKFQIPAQQSAIETTTEYKYKDIIEPYKIEVPKVESIRHAAGTLYYSVDPKEDPYKKLMQVHEEYFEIPMNRNLPKHVAPPKY
ncbi:AAEL007371-PA [Aedes aegypti]|uniref:AAEL007371-PA n=1 Tax=Aedes aegypti TaxID=7159 RepID=Q172J4_AEDAE|nr:AAEL007371-PA [Aedes aegypti]